MKVRRIDGVEGNIKSFQRLARQLDNSLGTPVRVDVLNQITLGSNDAKNALEHGVVSISEIPHDLWEPRKAGERVAWLEDVYRSSTTEDDTGDDIDD